MNIDMMGLKCFLAVTQTGSFTKAANQLGRTQSAISQQIAHLESAVGKPLFYRGKILSLTQDGDILLTYARKILALHLELSDRFKEPELAGELRFGLPEDFATVFLSDVLSDFARIHPKILLNIECDLTLNLLDRFRAGEFDLVLLKMGRLEDFPHGVEVWSEPLVWVGNKNMMPDPDRPLPLVLSPKPCVYRARAIKALEDAGIKWQLVFSSPSYTGKIAAVKANLGITVLPKNMIPASLDVLPSSFLPHLSDTHVSLLKYDLNNLVTQSLEQFVLEKLRH